MIGIVTEVKDDIISEIQGGPITYREGKVNALLEKTNGQKPFFASGNTMGDFQLIESSTHIKLAISSVSKEHSNYATEQKLAGHALKNSWYHLNYLS